MNRLRILTQRVRRSGDVSVCKLNDGYAVGTSRFGGNCSASITKRAAIQLAARWSMPSRQQVVIITQGKIETTIKTNSCGKSVATVVELST